MSHRLAAMVRAKQCGDLLRKAMLGAMADRANDAGEEIFASVRLLAGLAGCSERAVPNAVADLIAGGLIERVGNRPCRGGYTVVYRIVVTALEALPYVPGAAPKGALTPAPGADVPPQTTEPDADLSGDGTSAPRADLSAEGLHHMQSTPAPRADEPSLEPKNGGGGVDADGRNRPAFQIVADEVNDPRLDPCKSLYLVTEGAMVSAWIRDGADLHVDIIPTVRALLAKRAVSSGPVNSWRYFDRAVRDTASRRLAAQNAPAQPITAAAGMPAVTRPFVDFKREQAIKLMTADDRALRKALLDAGLNDAATDFENAFMSRGGMTAVLVKANARTAAAAVLDHQQPIEMTVLMSLESAKE